jgi:hypothetical protein
MDMLHGHRMADLSRSRALYLRIPPTAADTSLLRCWILIQDLYESFRSLIYQYHS